MNVLYIEDDAAIAEIYYIYLFAKFPKVNIVHFLDGQEAYTELQNNSEKYSLVIADFSVPGKNGGEIFKLVNGQMLGIPFILLSGYDCTRDENLKLFFKTHVRNAFLLKPCPPEEFTEKVVWCLGAETDKLKIYSKGPENVDEKISVSSTIFLKINSIPCDVFVKLSEHKFIKIILKNELFATSIVLKLISKGVEKFWINRSELSLYGDMVAQTLFVMLKSKIPKATEIEKSQLTGKALEIVRSNLLKCGFSPSILPVTEEIINMQVEMIYRSPELMQFMEKYQLFRKMNTEHSRLVSFISVAILKKIGWDSESTLHNITMASLFHDITLPDDYINKIVAAEYLKTLGEKEIKIYEQHAEESAHLARNFNSIAPGMQQVILEHHELPDGTGFPKKLSAQYIHPLSACLHMADVAADLLWTEDFDMDAVFAILQSKKEFYSKGHFRKPYDALLKIVTTHKEE